MFRLSLRQNVRWTKRPCKLTVFGRHKTREQRTGIFGIVIHHVAREFGMPNSSSCFFCQWNCECLHQKMCLFVWFPIANVIYVRKIFPKGMICKSDSLAMSRWFIWATRLTTQTQDAAWTLHIYANVQWYWHLFFQYFRKGLRITDLRRLCVQKNPHHCFIATTYLQHVLSPST